eukprot:scaffold7168_cov182-Amphora_coffeaeformis.AAC.4
MAGFCKTTPKLRNTQLRNTHMENRRLCGASQSLCVHLGYSKGGDCSTIFRGVVFDYEASLLCKRSNNADSQGSGFNTK